MSGSQSDPERLFDALREASPPAPLPALIVPEPTRSVRGGPIGPLVTGARRAILRILAPSLVELIGQHERERHQQRATILALQERVARLERTAPADR